MKLMIMDIIVLPNVEAKKREDVIKILGGLLYERGYVKETYVDATLKREVEYPTGLELLGSTNVSLPHADIEHVNEPALIVARLAKEVEFKKMDNPEESIHVKLVFMPAIKNPKEYIGILQKLTFIFKDPEAIERIKNAKPHEVEEYLRETLTSPM